MKFEQFMRMFNKPEMTAIVQNENFAHIVLGRVSDIMNCVPRINCMAYGELFEPEVISFGFYADELYVTVNMHGGNKQDTTEREREVLVEALNHYASYCRDMYRSLHAKGYEDMASEYHNDWLVAGQLADKFYK